MREAHSRANLSIASRRPLLEMVEVCFLAMGKPTQVDYAVSIIRNIEAHAANDVRYHMLVDKPPAPLEAQMRARAVWRGLPMERIRLQSVVDISGSARAMYTALRATATGPGGLYLYKPLLHLVLPRTVPRVIVLDTDLFVFASLRGLWDLFGRFDTPQLIGLAQARPPHIRPPMPPTHPPVRRRMPAASCVCTQHRPRGAGTWQEQCPSYQEVRALGGRGFNGGVQLLALDKMRASPHYGQLLWKHARRQLPMKPGGIGWLGALHGTTRHSRPDTQRHLPQHIASLATAVALAALSSLATPSRLAARVLFAPRGDPPPLSAVRLGAAGDQTLLLTMALLTMHRRPDALLVDVCQRQRRGGSLLRAAVRLEPADRHTHGGLAGLLAVQPLQRAVPAIARQLRQPQEDLGGAQAGPHGGVVPRGRAPLPQDGHSLPRRHR